MGNITTIILIALVVFVLFKGWRSQDKSDLWSPLTFISLTFVYYCVMPFYDDEVQFFLSTMGSSATPFFISTILFFCCVLIGFYRTKGTANFSRWNTTFTAENCKRVGLILFFLALICYVPVRGLHFSIGRINDDVVLAERTGFVNYLIDMVNTFCASACLLIASYKYKKNPWVILVLWLTLTTFIVAGFRSRLVVLMISACTTFYLFPRPRKPDYLPLAALAIGAYLFFAVMEQTRSYGRGLDLNTAQGISFSEMREGSKESDNVYIFSCRSIKAYDSSGERIGFEPILTAVLMPIPRSFFPWKPDGGYLTKAQLLTTGDVTGAAFFCYAEGFMSFGYIGVILYGLFLGWLAKKFWSNYKNNPTSLGAIIALGIFNGFCYKVISRGYLANAFIEYAFYICLPFWLAMLFKRLNLIKN